MTASPGLDEVDAELLKALRVIRGDHHNTKTGKSSQISQAIVSAILIQGKDTTDQNAQLLDAIKKQNTLLKNLTEVFSKGKGQVQPTFIPQKPRPVPQEDEDEDVDEDEDEDEEENCFHRSEDSLRACEDTKTKEKENRSVTDFQRTKLERVYMMEEVDGNSIVEEIDFILWGTKVLRQYEHSTH